MKSNLLVIICSGVSITLMGLLILSAPPGVRSFLERNMECALTIPPISVASYIFVFKYHEKFGDALPSIGLFMTKLLEGSLSALVFFFVTAVLTGLVYRFVVTNLG